MNVAYFGSGSRRLFGIYEPPPSNRASNRGIVLCPAWGTEYFMSHRSLRKLARMLSAQGMHVFRFDYFGTGDSSGDMADASLAGYENDIRSAIDELVEISHVQRVSLLGLRVGADLVARVALSGTHKVAEVVLWDPIVSGSDYLVKLAQKRTTNTETPVRETDGASWTRFVNAWGYAISDELRAEFSALNLLPLIDSLPARTLVATSVADHPLAGNARQPQQEKVSSIQFEHVESPSAWREEGNLGAAAIPTPLLNAIATWLIQAPANGAS